MSAINEQAAIHQFAKANLKFLTSAEYDRSEYKRRHAGFFYDLHRNRFGRPSVKDTQIAVVQILRQTGVATETIKQVVESAPFFVDLAESTRVELYSFLIDKEYASVLSKEELERVKQVGAYVALEASKGKEIEEKKQKELAELDKQIGAKRQEYDAIPSILDDDEVTEPEYEPEQDDKRPWWERFYLKGNPFPRKDGLSAIAEDLYEQVITRTKPFTETLSAYSRNPDCLFNTGFLLAGGYGYGKTTFIDYLSHFLIYRDVIPIRITCTRCSADSSGFADSFFMRLRKELFDEASKIASVDRSLLHGLELEDQVIELFRFICTRKGGVVVFVDDYHKYESHFPQIWEFFGTLQVLKDNLTRGGTKVGFVVSGLPQWKEELLRNSQLLGFLDGPSIEMPQITSELVCEMFNKRISAYCYEGTPRLIKADFVQKLVREFDGRVGFRDYIAKIVDELSNNNYAIVDSPIEISEEALEDIRKAFASDPAIAQSINKLIYGSLFKRFTQEQVAKCLELLVHIGMQGGIAELDREFVSNKYYFQVLRECGLIQKQRLGHTSSLKWSMSGRMRHTAKIVSDRHGLSPHDYLLKLYAYKSYGSAAPFKSELSTEFEDLKRFFAQPEINLPAAVADLIQLGVRLFEGLLLAESQGTGDAGQLARAKQAIESFSSALFLLDGSAGYFRRAEISKLRQQWGLHPLYDESIAEAFNRTEDYHREKGIQPLALAIKQARDVIYFVAQCVRMVLQDQCMDIGVGLMYRPIGHTEDAIEIFKEIRASSYSAIREDHFAYVRRITDYIELRFRSFFYLSGSLIFGANYFEQCPPGIVAYAYRNLDGRDSFVLSENRFNGLTRAQYRSIMCDGNSLREETLKHLDLPWKQSDWELFAGMFVEQNIHSSHIQVEAFDHSQRAKYLRYCRMAEELMAAINRRVATCLFDGSFILGDSGIKVADAFVRFSFRRGVKTEARSHLVNEWPKAIQSNKNAADHVVSPDVYRRVVEQIDHKLAASPDNVLRVDLLNIDYLTSHYRTSAAELMTILAMRIHVERGWVVEPWFGSSVLIRSRTEGSRAVPNPS